MLTRSCSFSSCFRTLVFNRFGFELFQNRWKVFKKVFYIISGVGQAKAEPDNSVVVCIHAQSFYGVRCIFATGTAGGSGGNIYSDLVQAEQQRAAVNAREDYIQIVRCSVFQWSRLL